MAILQVKRTTFQRPPEEKIFGVPRPLDPEGAREGTLEILFSPLLLMQHTDWLLMFAQ